MISGIGVPELLIVLVLALVVLGPKKLPEAGKSLGRGLREFKNSVTGIGGNDDDEPAALPVATAVEAKPLAEVKPLPAAR